jgi:hypothetical protein
MPRKTRKQKLTASKRKMVVATTSSPQINTPIMQTQKVALSPKAVKHAPVMSETEKTLRSHTIKDITKTVIIISLLFAAQAGIYFAHSKGLIAGLFQ